jgi:aspartate/methionine/tyrosine aminotransferase
MNAAQRMSRLWTESAFEVLARARALESQGKSIIHLEIGEPDFHTPTHIKEAVKRAPDAGATHYEPSAGLPELREAIAVLSGDCLRLGGYVPGMGATRGAAAAGGR